MFCKNIDQMAFLLLLIPKISLPTGIINGTIYVSKCNTGELRSKFIQLLDVRIIEPRGLSGLVTIFV